MPDFILHIKDSAITNKVAVRKAFASLKDGKYLVKIDAFKKRTLPQNAYLHGVVIPMVFKGLRNAGFDEVKDNEDAKQVIKALFLKRKIVSKETGEVIEIIRDTHELKTVEFNAFLEDVWKWAAEYLSIQIPMPNEQIVMFNEPVIAEYDNELKAIIVT